MRMAAGLSALTTRHDVECTKLAVIDGQVERRRQALECHLAARAARGLAGIVEAGDLLGDIGEIDLHPVALHLNTHTDRHAFPDPYAVIVHERLGFVDTIGDFAHARACRRLAVIHDRRDASDHGVTAVLADHFEETALTGSDRGDLGTEVAHGAFRQAHIGLDDGDEFLVRHTLAIDLHDRHL